MRSVGLRLSDAPTPAEVQRRLTTVALGRRLYYLDRVDSTNTFAAGLAAGGRMAPHGVVVAADRQTAGRGRAGRSWISPPGDGLYCSLVLRPRLPPDLAPLLTLAAAAALHDAIEGQTGLDVDIKWPNDLLVHNKKAAGVLSELQAEAAAVRAVIVGVGVNVNHAAMPEPIAGTATSLHLASGERQSRRELLAGFLNALEPLYEELMVSGPEAVVDRWTARSSFAAGRMLEVQDGVRRIRGLTRGLNRRGALRLEAADGRISELYSGDVLHWE